MFELQHMRNPMLLCLPSFKSWASNNAFSTWPCTVGWTETPHWPQISGSHSLIIKEKTWKGQEKDKKKGKKGKRDGKKRRI